MHALDQSSSDSSVYSTLKRGRHNPAATLIKGLEIGADPAVVLQRYNIAIFLDHKLLSPFTLDAFTIRPTLES